MTIYEAIGGFVVIFLASVGTVTLGLLVWQGARTTVKVVEVKPETAWTDEQIAKMVGR
jgi:hypothetical protein